MAPAVELPRGGSHDTCYAQAWDMGRYQCMKTLSSGRNAVIHALACRGGFLYSGDSAGVCAARRFVRMMGAQQLKISLTGCSAGRRTHWSRTPTSAPVAILCARWC